MVQKLENGVRVRYAPSPTGHWHVGGVRTAFFAWLFARKNKGAFVMRVEDTDRERSRQEFEIEIFEAMHWLGLDWDEGPEWTKQADGSWTSTQKGEYGPYRQTERLATYRGYLERLMAAGNAYYCYCTKEELDAEREALTAQGLPPKYGGHCRMLTAPPAGKTAQTIRFRVPETTVSFHDLIRGDVSFDAALFGDIVIAKDLDSPLYNFAVVVDDELMGITHVIRGEEHLSNTPKQILIQRALGFATPPYAHVPLALNPDRTKMSKRYNETALIGYRDGGYLPEALVNFLLLLGWHPKDNQEIMTLDEAIKAFEITNVQKAGGIFNEDKLNWFNREYLKKLSNEELAQRAAPFMNRPHQNGRFAAIVGAVRDRMTTLKDVESLAAFFFELPDYAPELLVWKKDTRDGARTALQKIKEAFAAIAEESFDRDAVTAATAPLMESANRGATLWPLRVALSGLTASPDPMTIAAILGKQDSLDRLEKALKKLA